MFLPNCGTWHVASALRFIYVLHSLYQAYGLIERSSPTNLTLTTPQDTVLICALAPRASYTGLILARSSVRLSSRPPDTSSPTPCGHTEGTTHQLTHPPQTRNWPSHPPLTVPHLAPTSDSRTSSPSYPSDSGEALAGHVPVGAHRLKLRKALVAPPLEDCGLDRRPEGGSYS